MAITTATTQGDLRPAYRTKLGQMYCGRSEDLLTIRHLTRYRGEVQLVFTSPPFPLNRKKKYGNLQGEEYVQWLAGFAPMLAEYLTEDGSIVIELGNAWEPGSPTISTLTLAVILAFKKAAQSYLCQEFICFTSARFPSLAQWINVECRWVKDALRFATSLP